MCKEIAVLTVERLDSCVQQAAAAAVIDRQSIVTYEIQLRLNERPMTTQQPPPLFEAE